MWWWFLFTRFIETFFESLPQMVMQTLFALKTDLITVIFGLSYAISALQTAFYLPFYTPTIYYQPPDINLSFIIFSTTTLCLVISVFSFHVIAFSELFFLKGYVTGTSLIQCSWFHGPDEDVFDCAGYSFLFLIPLFVVSLIFVAYPSPVGSTKYKILHYLNLALFPLFAYLAFYLSEENVSRFQLYYRDLCYGSNQYLLMSPNDTVEVRTVPLAWKNIGYEIYGKPDFDRPSPTEVSLEGLMHLPGMLTHRLDTFCPGIFDQIDYLQRLVSACFEKRSYALDGCFRDDWRWNIEGVEGSTLYKWRLYVEAGLVECMEAVIDREAVDTLQAYRECEPRLRRVLRGQLTQWDEMKDLGHRTIAEKLAKFSWIPAVFYGSIYLLIRIGGMILRFFRSLRSWRADASSPRGQILKALAASQQESLIRFQTAFRAENDFRITVEIPKTSCQEQKRRRDKARTDDSDDGPDMFSDGPITNRPVIAPGNKPGLVKKTGGIPISGMGKKLDRDRHDDIELKSGRTENANEGNSLNRDFDKFQFHFIEDRVWVGKLMEVGLAPVYEEDPRNLQLLSEKLGFYYQCQLYIIPQTESRGADVVVVPDPTRGRRVKKTRTFLFRNLRKIWPLPVILVALFIVSITSKYGSNNLRSCACDDGKWSAWSPCKAFLGHGNKTRVRLRSSPKVDIERASQCDQECEIVEESETRACSSFVLADCYDYARSIFGSLVVTASEIDSRVIQLRDRVARKCRPIAEDWNAMAGHYEDLASTNWEPLIWQFNFVFVRDEDKHDWRRKGLSYSVTIWPRAWFNPVPYYLFNLKTYAKIPNSIASVYYAMDAEQALSSIERVRSRLYAAAIRRHLAAGVFPPRIELLYDNVWQHFHVIVKRQAYHGICDSRIKDYHGTTLPYVPVCKYDHCVDYVIC